MTDLLVVPPPDVALAPRTVCERCDERGRALEAVAHGRAPAVDVQPPTPAEIRWAIDLLDDADRMLAPYGAILTFGKGARAVRACPRCANVGTKTAPVSLFDHARENGAIFDRRTRRRIDLLR